MEVNLTVNLKLGCNFTDEGSWRDSSTYRVYILTFRAGVDEARVESLWV